MKMKIFWITLIAISALDAKSYKAATQAYESKTVSAEVSGKIVKLNQEDELNVIDKELLVIDNALESEQLKNYKAKLANISEQLKIKEDHYEKITQLSGKSQREKENFLVELLSLKMQLSDLKNSIASLSDFISKKHLIVNNKYLKKLYVREGEFVNTGTKLFTIEDHSKTRVILYVDLEDVKDIDSKKIIVDGSLDHNYSLSKVSNSTDEEYISMYRVELTKSGTDLLGQVVTVEIGE
jgi:multidrug resistance efflux pump